MSPKENSPKTEEKREKEKTFTYFTTFSLNWYIFLLSFCFSFVLCARKNTYSNHGTQKHNWKIFDCFICYVYEIVKPYAYHLFFIMYLQNKEETSRSNFHWKIVSGCDFAENDFFFFFLIKDRKTRLPERFNFHNVSQNVYH